MVMSLENNFLPIVPEQFITPVIQEDFWTNIEKELFDHYKLSAETDTTVITEVVKMLSQYTESPSQLNDVVTIIKSFSYWTPEDINLLYRSLTTQLQDELYIEEYQTNPIALIQKTVAKISTQIEYQKQEQERNQRRELAYEKIRSIYDNNKDKINNSLWSVNKNIIINRISSTALQSFREAFWYKTIQSEQPGATLDREAVMYNDSIDNKIAGLVNYYAQLHDKVEQSKTNPKIKVTAEEKSRAENFTKTLQSLSISPEEFYGSLDIQYKEEKSNNNRSYELTTNKPSTSKESPSTPKESTLDKLPDSFDRMNTADMKIDIFKDQFNKYKEWFDDISLLQAFPLPKGTSIWDFDINNPKLMDVISSILENEKSHPLIESSTKNPEKIQRAKKLLIVRTLFEANPNLKELPFQIASELYPPQAGKEQNIPSRERKENIEKELYIPLMRNIFCDMKQEKLIAQEIKKWYMTYFNRLLVATPALKDFEFKPEEIVLKNDQVKLPLYLKWEKQINNYLVVEDGQIYITNALYNPLNADPNTLSKWKMRIWSIDDFKNFSEQIISSIKPDIIKKSVSDSNPRMAYHNKIQEVINHTINENNEKLSHTQAGIAHGLAWSKAQASIFNLMQHRHQDGESQSSDKDTTIAIDSPFYNILNNYTTDPTKTISKQDNIHWFEWLYLSKNTVLQHSANENELFSHDIHRLESLLSSRTFNLYITNYLKQKPTNELEQYKYNILQILHPNNRKKWESFALFLKLFGTHPERWKENINSIDGNKFHNFIDQLYNVGGNIDMLTVDWLINKNNPVFATLDATYGSMSADDELETNLDNIIDKEKIETITP